MYEEVAFKFVRLEAKDLELEREEISARQRARK